MAQDVKITVDFQVVSDINKNVKEINKNLSNLGKQRLANVTGVFNSISVGVIAVNQGLELMTRGFTAAANGVAFFARRAGEIEDISAQFETLTGSVQDAKRLLEDLRDFSARTPFQLPGIANAAKTLLAFGVEQQNIVRNLRFLGDAAAATNNSIEEIALIFGQVRAAGKLTGERFLQLAERGINVGPAIAKSMGVSEDALEGLRAQGKITFDIFSEAFQSLTKEGGIFFEGMVRRSKTLSGVLSTLSDNFDLIAADIGQQFLPILKEAAVGIINLIQANRDLIREKVKDYFDAFISGVVALLRALGTLARGIEKLKIVFQLFFDGLTLPFKTAINTFKFLEVTIDKIRSVAGIAKKDVEKITDKKPDSTFFDKLADGLENLQKKARQGIQIPKPKPIKIEIEKPTLIEQFKGVIEAPTIFDSFKRLGNIIKGAAQTVAPVFKKIGDNLLASGQKFFSSILQGGASGSRNLVGGVANAIGSAFGGPIVGKAVEDIVKVLSLPPEQFKALFEEFFKTLADIPMFIAENIPVFIDMFIRSIPQIIDGFNRAIPLLIDNLVMLLSDPTFWEAVIDAYISILLVQLGNPDLWIRVAEALIQAVIKGVPRMINAFIQALRSKLGPIFNVFGSAVGSFTDAIGIFDGAAGSFSGAVGFFSDIIGGLKSILKGGPLGGVAEGVGGVIESIPVVGDIVGGLFQGGGEIPSLSKFQDDGFGPAFLNAGELIVDSGTNDRLKRFLDSQEGNQAQSQTLVINLQVGEKELASVIQDLNQKGFRVA